MTDCPVIWYLTAGPPARGATAVDAEDAGIDIPAGVLRWARREGFSELSEHRILVAVPGEFSQIGHGLEPRSYSCIARYVSQEDGEIIIAAMKQNGARDNEP